MTTVLIVYNSLYRNISYYHPPKAWTSSFNYGIVYVHWSCLLTMSFLVAAQGQDCVVLQTQFSFFTRLELDAVVSPSVQLTLRQKKKQWYSWHMYMCCSIDMNKCETISGEKAVFAKLHDRSSVDIPTCKTILGEKAVFAKLTRQVQWGYFNIVKHFVQ